MANDKYSATWVSHTSITDFLNCPRSYFLKNVYKDSATGNKIQIITPSLSLGSAVHEVIDSLSLIPTVDRFKESPVLKFDRLWPKFSGKQGGFTSLNEEHKYKERGKAMLRRIMDNPGPLANQAIKIKADLPFFWLSESEEIILCGKIDWLEYLPDTNAVHILDFKTSKKEEESASLQLPIYLLLSTNCQRRQVTKASYWYLDFSNYPKEKSLPDYKTATDNILDIARKIKLAKKLNKFDCPNGSDGCPFCSPFESIITHHQGERVGEMGHRDTYFMPPVSKATLDTEEDSYII